MMKYLQILLGLVLYLAVTCVAAPSLRVEAPLLLPTVLQRYAHDPACSTQGLVWAGNGTLFESSGLPMPSEIRQVEIATGRPLKRQLLPRKIFAEGLALSGGQLVLSTYQDQRIFRFDPATLEPIRDEAYPYEGWGLTTSPDGLILASDGTSKLRWLDPLSWVTQRSVEVKESSGPVVYLNELEYSGTKILANVYTTNLIAIIDPSTGRVDAWLDLRGLLTPAEQAAAGPLNGIAVNPTNHHLYVTGKRWPWLFEIEVDYDLGLE